MYSKKFIHGGFQAEPYYRYETLAGFIITFAGEEAADISLRPGSPVRYSTELPEYRRDYIESFCGLASAKMYAGGNYELVAWWASFDLYADTRMEVESA